MKPTEFLAALESGELRAASRDAEGTWHANPEVKEGILELFRRGKIQKLGVTPFAAFRDKDTLPTRHFDAASKVRVVPGGTSVRRGAHLAQGVVLMPPAYVNVGAYVGEGSMIDSHALVGSCAQVGARVHVGAASQIGGVLEPIGATPVVIEDDVFVGGNVGVYEGVLVRERAVLAPGVILSGGTRVFDLVNERELSSGSGLEIPAGAVVVPGARPATGAFAREAGLTVACALIVKIRDANTDAATTLEDALR